MPSDRRTVAFRPDEDEEKLLAALSKKHGLPMTRVLGQALRRWAELEGVVISSQSDPGGAVSTTAGNG